ncbi:MAG TPA: acyl carrier protein [Streptosporangiaceae bacterium]
MNEEIREFILKALKEMNYDVSDVTGDTDLGPAGLDLESLAVAELAVRVEDHFGLKFTDEDGEELALMTLDEFTAEVGSRIAVPAGEPE